MKSETGITYLTGDATCPLTDGPAIIAHCCNDLGKWGRGFVLSLSARWPEPEAAYRALTDRPLGLVQLVKVDNDPLVLVANIIGQHGVYPEGGVPPVRYEAIRLGFWNVATVAKGIGASVHMPRVGCGLAGGDWDVVEQVIEHELRDVDVFVYDLSDRRRLTMGGQIELPEGEDDAG